MTNNITCNKEQWGLTEVKFEKYTYNWTISNFPYFFIEPGKYLSSPKFSIFPEENPSRWLRLHFREDTYYVELHHYSFVTKLGGDGNRKVWSLITKTGKKFEEKTIPFPTSKDNIEYYEIKKDKVLSEKNYLLPFGCLTIHLEIIINKGCVNTTSAEGKHPKRPLEARPFEKLFLADNLSDVQLVAKCGRSLPAHKSVLVTCSPEFEKIFALEEPGLTRLETTDCTYEALKEMLRFVYTGKLEGIDVESNAAELLELAGRYQLDALGTLCEEALERSISTGNVMQVIAIAGRHNRERLKTYASKFALAHIGVIFASDQFKFATHPDLLKSFLEVLCTISN